MNTLLTILESTRDHDNRCRIQLAAIQYNVWLNKLIYCSILLSNEHYGSIFVSDMYIYTSSELML